MHSTQFFVSEKALQKTYKNLGVGVAFLSCLYQRVYAKNDIYGNFTLPYLMSAKY